MTSYYYSINNGQNEHEAVVATSTNSKDIELVVDGSKITTKEQVLLALKKLEAFITRSKYTPA